MRRGRYLVVIAVALGGCGAGASASDTGDLERDLVRTVEDQTGTVDVKVDCPDGAGEEDVCDVTAPGGIRAQVTVEGKVVQP
jgi:hypothetical protein